MIMLTFHLTLMLYSLLSKIGLTSLMTWLALTLCLSAFLKSLRAVAEIKDFFALKSHLFASFSYKP